MGITNSLFVDTESTHPVKVISAENNVFQLHTDELKVILENDNIKDHYVMVLSIAGAFMKGKSFLMNIFLRYLEAQVRKMYSNLFKIHKISFNSIFYSLLSINGTM